MQWKVIREADSELTPAFFHRLRAVSKNPTQVEFTSPYRTAWTLVLSPPA